MGICSNMAGCILIILQNLAALVYICLSFCAILDVTIGKICKEAYKVPQTPWGLLQLNLVET